jgi:hypothetical protein
MLLDATHDQTNKLLINSSPQVMSSSGGVNSSSDHVERVFIKKRNQQSRKVLPPQEGDLTNFPSFNESLAVSSSGRSTEVKKLKNIINNNYYQVYTSDATQSYTDFFTKREVEPKVILTELSSNNVSLDKTPSFIYEDLSDDDPVSSKKDYNVLNITNITQININDPNNVHKITITSTPNGGGAPLKSILNTSKK